MAKREMDKIFENKICDNFQEALNRFDIAKAANIMDFLNWCWWQDNYPPTHEMILGVIKQLFEDAKEGFDGEYISCGTGGFLVTIYKKGKVSIQFVPVQSYSFD